MPEYDPRPHVEAVNRYLYGDHEPMPTSARADVIAFALSHGTMMSSRCGSWGEIAVLATPTGWLVAPDRHEAGTALAVVSDPDHAWASAFRIACQCFADNYRDWKPQEPTK